MIQRYSPEGWRDIKIGSGIATLFAHNSQGQLLSEQNHPLDALTQDARYEVQNVLVAQLAQAIATGHPLTEPVAAQAAEILYATLEEQHNNDDIQNLVIDTIQSLVEQLPGLNAQLPSLSDQATRLASAEAKWRIKPQLREYIYLQGQPLAMITSRQAGAPNELFTIHTDHLGTPMWVTDGLGAQRVWDPILEPFGNIHQEDTPAIQGTPESLESDLDTLSNHASTEAQQTIDISMPLRFAGQYFDTETQLHYNYYRDYDPSIGRYVQSDPIGLGGGVNAYGYVEGNPVGFLDPLGLVRWEGTVNIASLVAVAGFVAARYHLESECVDGLKANVSLLYLGPALGAGLRLTASTSNIAFEDHKDQLAPWNLHGFAGVTSAGVQFFSAGAGVGKTFLGDAYQRPTGAPESRGLDASVSISMGSSTLDGFRFIECECDE